MQITINGSDITFIGFKNENRPITPDEAKEFLWFFYARAWKVINEQQNDNPL